MRDLSRSGFLNLGSPYSEWKKPYKPITFSLFKLSSLKNEKHL